MRDHTWVVDSWLLEVYVLREQKSADLPKALQAAADACRLRAECRLKFNHMEGAIADYRLVLNLEREACKSQVKSEPLPLVSPAKNPGEFELVNDRKVAVTILLGSDTYRLQPGERRVLQRPPGDYYYEVPDIQGTKRLHVDSGKRRSIRVYDRECSQGSFQP